MSAPRMGASSAGVRLPTCLRGFPGAVLHLSRAGTVLDSNGRLEAALDLPPGQSLAGRPFAEAIDADASRAKWERLLAGTPGRAEGVVAELLLAEPAGARDPRAFSILWEPETATVWLVEHPRDVRLDHLRDEVTEVNSELASTQRDLTKERSRLARAVAELEAQYREQERLAAVLQEQNAEIEAQNETLLATTAELERSNRALDEFAHVVSHDLKAPLRSIANGAQWLVEDLGDALAGEPRAHLALLREQVGRMRTMIDGLLAYARAGRAGSAPEAVDVGALLREIVALLDPPSGVTVTVDDPMPVLRTARAPLQQVLQNLVDNAIKHARRADPRVRVSARVADGWCEFAVADNGPGIPARLQERVWALFHTLEPSDGAERTGIGLAVVRRLVEAQGGHAWIESREDAGATFRFRWPAPSPAAFPERSPERTDESANEITSGD